MAFIACKAVALFIMDKDVYIEKFIALLNDEEVHKECRDQMKTIHSKAVKQHLDLNNSTGY